MKLAHNTVVLLSLAAVLASGLAGTCTGLVLVTEVLPMVMPNARCPECGGRFYVLYRSRGVAAAFREEHCCPYCGKLSSEAQLWLAAGQDDPRGGGPLLP